MATNFGKTWWGEQWLNSLRNIDYSNRLPRGASYARKGAVEKITVNGNHIVAKVKGSRPRPYMVNIIMPPFFDPELSLFLQELSENPVIISKLLNRELDPSVLKLSEKFGLKVFPQQWNDLKMTCSCPDWAVPCKHLASVVYKVSAEIDNNPFLAFSLHNVDLLEELQKMGLHVSKKQLEIPRSKEVLFNKKEKQDAYNPDTAYYKLNFSGLEQLHEPLTELLSPFPAFYTVGSRDFREKYRTILNRIVRNTQKAASGKIPLPNFLDEAYLANAEINKHTSQNIRFDESLKAKIYFDDKELPVIDFLQQLAQIKGSHTLDYQPSTAVLHTALHLSIQLLANGAVIPQIIQVPQKKYCIRWLPAMLSKEVKQLVIKLGTMVPPGLITAEDRKRQRVVNKDVAQNLLSLFITEIVRLTSYHVSDDIFEQLFFKSIQYPFLNPGEEALAGGILSWLQKFYLTQGEFKPSVIVEELNDGRFKIDLTIQNNGDLFGRPLSLKEVLDQEHFAHRRFEVLQGLMLLSSFIPGLDEYINSKCEDQMILDIAEFTPFLMKFIPAIQLLDINVLLPKSLQALIRPKPSVRLKSKGKGSGFMRLDKLFDFEWQVAIGDTVLGEQEFKQLLQKSEGLVKFKTKYIYVGKGDLNKLYRHFSQTKGLSAFQMLRTALSGEYFGANVIIDDKLQQKIKELSELKEIPVPAGLNATLRPYQRRGYSWMCRNAQIGFGSVLADDMGLGKTIQVIAAILKFKAEGLLEKEKILIIAPTGLLSNWQAEFDKFAPGLDIEIYHGPNRLFDKNGNYDVLITSYGIVRSDATLLNKGKWNAVVIDEAQNIKNQGTGQTKAVKSIKSSNFIAMSGTPVENRLSELWSIMDYSNRGILGSVKEFAETFGNPIERLNDVETAEKLKKVTSPFMMRRLKTDKSIISDLPEKIEIDSFATLTKEQAGLYEKVLEKAMQEIEGISAGDQKSLFVRQGLVLQMILALKQICNHPTQYLKNGIKNAGLSGKTDLLFNKLDSITESNEKVLIFTQFTEMGKLLEEFISEKYKDKPLFYHGGCSVKKRAEMIDQFQNNRADKIFILSLKAAGTGLNLTAANHVIHYDLWWNPAVESQATDRAYRIGQKKDVMVHRFITKNSFEEKINDMIQQKKNLAQMTVATGENWIGNLSNRELRGIFNMK